MTLTALLALSLTSVPSAFTPPPSVLATLEKAEAALAASPKDVGAIAGAVVARKMAGKFDEAVALASACNQPQCRQLKASMLAETDDAAAVLPWLEAVQKIEGAPAEDLAAIDRLQSTALLRVGKPVEAAEAARRGLALSGNLEGALVLAAALVASGELDAADRVLTMLAGKAPGHGMVRYWSWRVGVARKLPAEQTLALAKTASDAIEKALSTRTDRADYQLALAEVLAAQGRKDDASQHRAIAAVFHLTRFEGHPE